MAAQRRRANAAGPWAAALAATAGVDLPLEPIPRIVVTTGPFPGVPERRTLVIDADSSFYLHREGDGVLMGMGGADEPTFDTQVDERFVAEELLPKALEVFPPLAAAGIRSTWAGLYEMTPDRHPVIGPSPVDGLWLAERVQRPRVPAGPVVGKLLAEMIVDGRPCRSTSARLGLDRFARGDLVREHHVV